LDRPVLWSRLFAKGCGAVRLVLAVLATLAATPALALEVLESVLQVSYTHDGKSQVFNDTYVPLLPGNACYTWHVRVDRAGAPVDAVERMTLPVAIDWGTQPTEATVIEEGGKVAVTTLPVLTDELGWFSHGWCVAEGDPTGEHLIEVAVDGATIASFPFTVLAEDEYNFPAPIVPDRSLRSADGTW
jgi:hypothetical protein